MKKFIFVLVVVALSLTGAAWLVGNHGKHDVSDDGYTTQPVEFGDLTESISTTGVIQPRKIVPVFSEQPGRVKRVLVDFNQTVKAGDVLIELDDQKARLDLAKAEAAVRTARSGVLQAEAVRRGAEAARDKIKSLLGQDIGKQTDLDRAQAELDVADAAVAVVQGKVEQADTLLNEARYGVDLMAVRSPCAGVIIDRKVVRNQLVGPAAGQLLVIAQDDLGTLHLYAQIAEGDVGKVKVGQEVSFQVYAYSENDRHFPGRVTEIRPMPASVQGAVYYTAVIEIHNVRDTVVVGKTGGGSGAADAGPGGEQPGGSEAGVAAPPWLLLPGMSATVDVIRRKHRGVWKMPAAAVNFQPPEPLITEPARAKLARWRSRPDADDWRHVWYLDQTTHKPMPLCFRVTRSADKGPTADADAGGIQDPQYFEVLDWEPTMTFKPEPGAPGTSLPRVITAAPVQPQSGFLKTPKIKLS